MIETIEKLAAGWRLAGLIRELSAGERQEFWRWLKKATVSRQVRTRDLQFTVTVPLPAWHPARVASRRKRSDGQLKRRMQSVGTTASE
jgi:hypothetical protein